ncbi:MAG: type II toxin-antitoxin system VapC family toxin [Promethearchaeota archaeon]|nr:MAG: type II toxin-antitoxin system VapC family toxin [Candidatus Lokiarchaeota archaeon]
MKLYIETSVINFLFAEDSPEKMKITKEFFNNIAKYQIYISDIVLLEIEQAPEHKRKKLMKIITKYKMKALESNEEAEKLADKYVSEGIVPNKYYNDALHIAIATKYKMDAIVSWNLTHIVKLNTKFKVKEINEKLKEKDVIICTPEEIV